MLTRQFPVRRPYGPTALIRKTFAQLPTHTLLCRTALVLLESIRRNQSDGVRPWGLGKNSISASMRAETLHSPKPHGLTPSARLPRQSGRARIDTHKLRAASLCWTAAPNFGHAPSPFPVLSSLFSRIVASARLPLHRRESLHPRRQHFRPPMVSP